MAYICYCKDIPGSAALRKAHTADHLAYIEGILDRVLVAGPMLKDGTSRYDSSLFIYDVHHRNEALELLHNDPYYKAGIYAEVECREYVPAAGEWIGGKTWK